MIFEHFYRIEEIQNSNTDGAVAQTAEREGQVQQPGAQHRASRHEQGDRLQRHGDVVAAVLGEEHC